MSASEVTITRTGSERIADVEPLFAALNNYQVAVAPTLTDLPPRSDGDAWARRRAKYEAWLSKPGAFLLLAEDAGSAVGYAVVSIGEGYDGWNSPERIGDLHDFAVLPHVRGKGIGTTLMDAVERELLREGIEYCRLRVIARNVDAARFYERRGMIVVSHIMLGRVGDPHTHDDRE